MNTCMPIFASSGAFLKPGEAENKRTIQTEVNTHGSMVIIVDTSCLKKSEKHANIDNNDGQIPFWFHASEKSVNKLLKYPVKTSYGRLIGKWDMM